MYLDDYISDEVECYLHYFPDENEPATMIGIDDVVSVKELKLILEGIERYNKDLKKASDENAETNS